MATNSAVDEDWDLLMHFFPPDWKAVAARTGALKGLRQDKVEENYLRTLLIHLGCGHSLRETVVRARKAQLADLSDVALLKRLRKAKDWLHGLCCGLFAGKGVKLSFVHLTTARLRRETTLTVRCIAQRLHMGSWKSPSNKLFCTEKTQKKPLKSEK